MVNFTPLTQTAAKLQNNQVTQSCCERVLAFFGYKITSDDATEVSSRASGSSILMSAPTATDRMERSVPLSSITIPKVKTSLGNEAYSETFKQTAMLVKQVMAGDVSGDTETALQDFARAGIDVKDRIENREKLSRKPTVFAMVVGIAVAKYQSDKAKS